jgi:hypothetical protein
VITARNFGLTNQATVSGTVFFDANKNRKKDAAEKGLKAWQLFIDKDRDGRRDANELLITTNSLGNFSFKTTAGTITLRAIVKKGYKATTPTGGVLTLTLKPGQTVNGRLFGIGK